jgi:NapH/MauN family ferredoxin-type protein
MCQGFLFTFNLLNVLFYVVLYLTVFIGGRFMGKWKWQYLRYLVQIGFVAYLAWFAFGPLITGGRGGELHSLCPFGGVETLPTFFGTFGARFARESSSNNFVLLGALLIAVIAFGGAFCGWACPVGTVGEWLYKLRKLFIKKDLQIPQNIHRILGWARYVVLALVLVMSFLTATLWFDVIDPFMGLFSAKIIFGAGIAVIVIFAIGSFVIERFFCKYLCPMGATIKPFAKISATGIIRDPHSCNSCGNCDDICPKQIPVSSSVKIDRGECISCMKCVEHCSSGNCLTYQIGW